MTLGEWLNAMILEQGGEDAGAGGFHSPADQSVQDQLDSLSEQIRRLVAQDQDTAIGLYPRNDDDLPRVDDLITRIDTNERYTVEALTAVNDRLIALAEQMAGLARIGGGGQAKEGGSYKALESAMRNIVEHIEVSERRTRDSLKSVQDRVSDLQHRSADSQAQAPMTAQLIADLEGKLEQLSERIDQAVSAPSETQEIFTFVETHIADLTQRMEAVRHSAEAFAQRAERSAVAATRNEIEALDKHLQAMVEQMQALLRHQSAAGGDLAGIRAEIGGLDQRIDDLKAESATERDLHSIRVSLDQLGQRMAQAASQAAVGDLDRRLSEVAARLSQLRNPDVLVAQVKALEDRLGGLDQRLDDLKVESASERDLHSLRQTLDQLGQRTARSASQSDLAELDRRVTDVTTRLGQMRNPDAILPQLSDIEARVGDIDRRLADVQDFEQIGPALANVEQQVEAMHQRLGAAEEQLGGLAAIEHSIQQLYDSLHETRDYMHNVADTAVDRAAQQFMENLPNPGSSPEIVALETALEALRAQAAQSEQQTQETLEAVHDTLEHIVNKLAELDGQGPAVSRPPADRHARGYEPDEAPDGDAAAGYAAAAEGELPVDYDWQAAVHDHLARESDMLHSDPDEREEGLPLTGLAAAEKSAATEAESHDQPEGPVDFGDDYIAAARMAAQVAADSPAADDESEAATAEPFPTSRPKRGGFSLPFFRRRAKKPRVVHGMETTVIVAGGAPTKDAEVKRKRLILAALLVLAAVSAFTVRGVYEAVNSKSGAKSVPERVEQKPRVEFGPADPAYRTAADLGPSHARQAASADPVQTGSLGAVLQHRVKPAKVIRAPEDLAAARLDALPQAIGTDALREAALKGNPIAQFVIATRFFGGQNVEQNQGSAVRWYRKAAEQGLAPAQYRLATLLERGKGVAVDQVAARHWYEEAARKGNVRAMHNLAVLLINGANGSPDYANAAFWFRSAADHGLKDSQYNLAILCERGYGVQQDEGEAFFWYTIAARDGDEDAARRARVVETAIPASARQEVEARLRRWHAKDIDPAANAVAVAEPSWQAGLVPPVMTGSNNPIAMAQALLDGLGLSPGPVDGRMGSGTAKAIRHFQLKSALPVDGQVTPALLAKLQDAYGRRLT
jgi:localization factor PodJL